ncbi:unnamed protein product [Sphagnum jensenii]|uniref:Secreted protein n=1 Tax=Sphagnum jensenii TaxID=128206 RepID=A0ABP1BT88_9BRYO
MFTSNKSPASLLLYAPLSVHYLLLFLYVWYKQVRTCCCAFVYKSYKPSFGGVRRQLGIQHYRMCIYCLNERKQVLGYLVMRIMCTITM